MIGAVITRLRSTQARAICMFEAPRALAAALGAGSEGNMRLASSHNSPAWTANSQNAARQACRLANTPPIKGPSSDPAPQTKALIPNRRLHRFGANHC